MYIIKKIAKCPHNFKSVPKMPEFGLHPCSGCQATFYDKDGNFTCIVTHTAREEETMAIKNCGSYNKKGECRHQRVVRFESRGRNFLACNKKCPHLVPLEGVMVKYKADFLWPHKDGSIEQAGYEFANAITEEYRQQWWKILLERIAYKASLA